MAIVNLTQAAHMAGISRVTLNEHIKKGKISKTEDATGNKGIDTAELMRVYGSLVNNPAKEGSKAEQPLHSSLQQEIATLRQELKAAHDLLDEKENHIATLKQMNLLLAEKIPVPTPPQPEPTPELLMQLEPRVTPEPTPRPESRRGLWSRIFSRGYVKEREGL